MFRRGRRHPATSVQGRLRLEDFDLGFSCAVRGKEIVPGVGCGFLGVGGGTGSRASPRGVGVSPQVRAGGERPTVSSGLRRVVCVAGERGTVAGAMAAPTNRAATVSSAPPGPFLRCR